MSEFEVAHDEVHRKIIELVLEGLPNRVTARRVGLAEGTVKWRLRRLYKAVGVSSRVQFVNEIRRRGPGG